MVEWIGEFSDGNGNGNLEGLPCSRDETVMVVVVVESRWSEN